MKTKVSKVTVRAFVTKITQKNRHKKVWVDKGTEFAAAFKKLCKTDGEKNYSKMSETKSAFAERTIRSLKNILRSYMIDYGYKYIQKMTQNITTLNSRKNVDRLVIKECKEFQFFVHSAQQKTTRNQKTQV